jgi:hypothetical protein
MDRKKIFWAIASVFIAILSIWTVVSQSKHFSFEILMSFIINANKGWLFMSFVCTFGFIWFEGFALVRMARHFGYKTSAIDGTVYGGADVYFSAITPSASGGQPASAYFMIRDGIPGYAATVALLINLVMYTLSLLTIGILCMFFKYPLLKNFSGISRIFIYLGIIVLIFLAFVFYMLLRKGGILYSICDALIRFLEKIHIIRHGDRLRMKLKHTMKEQCFDKYNCMTVAEAPGVDDAAFERYAGKNGYFSMIFDFGWENMEGENDKSSIHAVERWKKKMFTHVAHNSGIGWSAIFLENHDQSRCLNKFLERENISFYSASALASIYFFLYGTPFIYQGQEIGMTNVKWKNINDMDDIRAKRTYEEAVGQGKDPDEVLAYFSELGRDNARTPMQWDDSENGGFTCGKPWIKCNDNYRTINAQSEVNDPDSLYNYYKRLIQCYHDHADIVRQAEFRPMYEEYPGLFAYEREVNGKGLLVIVNFTNEKLMFQKIDQKCELCNYHETESEWLQPYEARIYSK